MKARNDKPLSDGEEWDGRMEFVDVDNGIDDETEECDECGGPLPHCYCPHEDDVDLMIQAFEPDDSYDIVDPENRCPKCDENRIDWLAWVDEDTVECTTCATRYTPPASSYNAPDPAWHK